jgi:uncharacterized membrane protein
VTAGPGGAPRLDSCAVTEAGWPGGWSGRWRRGRWADAALVLGVAAVLAQITYPLLHGEALRAATIGAVLFFTAASLTHAVAWWGLRAGAAVLVTAGAIGLAAEAVGVATGVPFGRYAYAGTLGPQVLGVPVLVPLAWTMMAYPALLLGRRLAGRTAEGRARRVRVALLGGATLAAWDLFLDPQMVAAGHWTWAEPRPSLPGVQVVPLTNAVGWLLVGVVLVAALDRVLPASPPDVAREALPAALLAWTWLGSTLANLAFFHRPWVALYGGVGLGLLVAPYLRSLLTDARAAHDRRPRPVTA